KSQDFKEAAKWIRLAVDQGNARRGLIQALLSTNAHGAEPPAIAAAYDFSSCKLIVDVGGASGNLLGHVLAAHRQPRGVLFDLPQAMTDAPARLQALGVADRVTIQAGDALEAVPPGADVYL